MPSVIGNDYFTSILYATKGPSYLVFEYHAILESRRSPLTLYLFIVLQMEAVVALCHFCEVHGPTVLSCTQVCPSSALPARDDCPVSSDRCCACSAFQGRVGRSVVGLVSTDEEDGQLSYVTSAQCLYPDVTSSLVKAACVRSLSCEIHVSSVTGPDIFCKEGGYYFVYYYLFPILFGLSTRIWSLSLAPTVV